MTVARLVSSWCKAPETATPSGVAAAAQAAGVLVEVGDYTIGTLDLGDDDTPVGIQVTGVIVNVHGSSWLVHPGSTASDGWLVRCIEQVDQVTRPAYGPARWLADSNMSADGIVAALLVLC